jgi:hypothetical protein
MLKANLLIIVILVTITAAAQLKANTLTKNDIPVSIKYSGKIVYAVRYADSFGDHILVATETGEIATKNAADDSYRDATLYAYNYAVLRDSVKLTWKLTDYVKECPVDISASYIKDAFAVTDLNKDGKAEVWLMYKTVCRGDVSPGTMKIIMYENDRKSAIRGTNKVKYTEKDYTGGEYSFDDSFKKGPAVFRDYATALWEKNILETWE